MSTVRFLLIIMFAAALTAAGPAAQHEGHQMPAASSAAAAPCPQVQPAINNIIAAATARLEAARQSNNPADMRAAIDSMDAALRDIRTQLAVVTTRPAHSPADHGEHGKPGSHPAHNPRRNP